MTKEIKTAPAEIVKQNLKEFTAELHQLSKEAVLQSILEKDEEVFATANIIHDISHCLIDILKGKTVEEAFEHIFADDDNDDVEESTTFVSGVAVNLKTGDIKGIENIKNPELKKQLVSALNQLTEKLEGE